jgi:hypothetical protein
MHTFLRDAGNFPSLAFLPYPGHFPLHLELIQDFGSPPASSSSNHTLPLIALFSTPPPPLPGAPVLCMEVRQWKEV